MSCGSPDGKPPADFFSELQARAQVDDGMPPPPPPPPPSLDFTPPDLDTIRQRERHGVL